MKLELKDMKISKVNVCKNEEMCKSSSTEVVYGLQNQANILNSTTFALIIKRNLSAGWYKDVPELDVSGRLKTIEVISKFCALFVHDKYFIAIFLKLHFN